MGAEFVILAVAAWVGALWLIAILQDGQEPVAVQVPVDDHPAVEWTLAHSLRKR
jgi:hypothetical protein